jgi:YD repeat-containing protein
MTIAQQIKWDFKTNGLLVIRDKNGKPIYLENSDGVWEKYEWDSQGKLIYLEYSHGTWRKWELDSEGKVIYYENSYGEIIDSRPKPCEGKVVEFKGLGLFSMFAPGGKYKLVKV